MQKSGHRIVAKGYLTNLHMTPSGPWLCFSNTGCCETLERAVFLENPISWDVNILI